MESVYKYSDYREYIGDFVKNKKRVEPSVSFSKLAESIRVEKSYVSKVMNKKSHFSPDQLFFASEHLKLDHTVYSFLELLNIAQTTGSALRRERVEHELKRRRVAFREVKEVLAGDSRKETWLAEYYSHPLFSLIREGFTIPRYQKDMKALANDLQLNIQYFGYFFDRLVNWGLVIPDGNQFKASERTIHLEKDDAAFGGWHSQMRNMSLSKQISSPPQKTFGFTATFASNEQFNVELTGDLIKVIENARKKSEGIEKTLLCQLNIDFHPWT